jgi:hypothetical protein
MGIVSGLSARVQRGRDFLRFLYTQRVKGFSAPGRPHLDPETSDWFEQQLRITGLYLEFGSGGSTVLANKLSVQSVSVESDRFYADAVKSALQRADLAEIIVPRMGFTSEWGMPVFGRRKKGGRYVGAPFGQFEEQFPDFVLVDGRYRVACSLEVARQANIARAECQLMVDDYGGRPFYHVLEKYLGTPRRTGRAAVFRVGQNVISEASVRRFLSDPR